MLALAYRDDPARTAPPYQGPGEVEPEDSPVVSKEDAVKAVKAVLYGESTYAFGETADWWCEVLMDQLADVQWLLLLSILDGRNCPSAGDRLNELLGNFIDQQVNELVAEKPGLVMA